MRQLFLLFITLSLVSSGMQSAEQADSIAEVIEVLVADSVADSSVVPVSDAVAGPDSPIASQPGIKPAVDYYRFRWPQTIAPGVMIAAGSVGVNCFIGFKEGIRADFAKLRGDRYLHFDDYIQYVPAIGYLGVGFIPGTKKRGDFVDRLLCGATAYILMAATTNAIKYSVREKRPDSNTRNSFPSGHTANAFCGAELMRIEYGNWVGLAGYAVAVTTGVMRMYNERHWWNDVIAGAGIGILCARTAYWLLPLERKLFRRDRRISREHELEFHEHERSKLTKKKETAFTAVPYYDASARGAGVAIAAFF